LHANPPHPNNVAILRTTTILKAATAAQITFGEKEHGRKPPPRLPYPPPPIKAGKSHNAANHNQSNSGLLVVVQHTL